MTSLKRILQDNEIAFGYRIGYLFNHFSVSVYRWTTAEYRIQRPQFATLFCAARLGRASATDVVTLTGIPRNSVSRAVADLIENGMLKRADDINDGRRAILSLTPKGRKVFESILPRFQDRQERMLAVLSGAERRELDRLLNKLVERDDDWAQAETT